MKGGRKVPAWSICTILAAVSCGVYLNTLQAGFTFDDFFAVVGTFSSANALPAPNWRTYLTAWLMLNAHLVVYTDRGVVMINDLSVPCMQIKNDDVSNEASSITKLFYNDFWCGSPSCHCSSPLFAIDNTSDSSLARA